MVKAEGFRGMIFKIAAAAVLAIIAAVLFYMNKNLMLENKKMIKYIKNEAVFKQDLENLRKSEDLFSRYIIRIKKGGKADLEKIKADYFNELLRLIETSNLKVDSYRSEIEEKDGFVIFRYDITIVGDFVRVVGFFSRLRKQSAYVYIDKYVAELHREKMIRMALTVEIPGFEQ